MPPNIDELEYRNRQLELEAKIREIVREERKMSDDRYAWKIVQHFVFGFISLILVAVVGAWIALVIAQ